mgnify:CR=1 FL=1
MNYWKKLNAWFEIKPKYSKTYLIIGIIFFACYLFLSGLEEVPYLKKKSISRFIILIVPNLIGFVCLLKYFYSRNK